MLSRLLARTGPANFPLDRMPVELVRMICSYLTPTQVASIRFLNKTIAAIGLEYIATTVTLTLKEESFDRLLEIAHHPILSKHVQTLRYEHDFLTDLDQRVWEYQIRTPELESARNKEPPGFGASERKWRAFRRECRFTVSRKKYGKKRLDQVYSTYQIHRAEQEHTRRSGFFIDKLAHGLQHLPNLRLIYMPTLGSYSRYQKEIAESLDGATFDQSASGIESDSVAVTRSILLAIDRAVRDSQNVRSSAAMVGDGAVLGARSWHLSDTMDDDQASSNQMTAVSSGRNSRPACCSEGSDLVDSNQRVPRIKKFSSESLSWKLFLEDEAIFRVMKRSISYLTTLNIRLLDSCQIKDGRSPFAAPIDVEAQSECTRRGLLHEFVASAPDLEELSVSFGLNMTHLSISVTDLVGSFHWTSLKKFHVKRMCIGFGIGIGDLIAFCSRHSSTLSDLSLGDLSFHDMPLLGGRNLYSMFTRIREATKLEKARVYGVFRGSELWNLHDHADERCQSGTLIGRYLVGEGGNSGLKNFMSEECLRISEEGESNQ